MKEIGELSFSGANDANIPVGIFFDQEDDDGEKLPDNQWRIRADNYMPRKCRVEDGAYNVIGTKDELKELIRQYILPLYQTAVKRIEGMIDGSNDKLYYWE